MKITILRDKSRAKGEPDRLEEFAKFILLAVLCIVLFGMFTPVPGRPLPPPRPDDSRNAQNLASVCSSAIAAGSKDFREIDNAWDAALVIRRGTYGGGDFADTLLVVPNISEQELREAMKHLVWKPIDAEGRGGLIFAPGEGWAGEGAGEDESLSALKAPTDGELRFDSAVIK